MSGDDWAAIEAAQAKADQRQLDRLLMRKQLGIHVVTDDPALSTAPEAPPLPAATEPVGPAPDPAMHAYGALPPVPVVKGIRLWAQYVRDALEKEQQ